MYSVSAYGGMIADETRMDCYARALERCVTPNSVVVDIGAGTGILALLACRLGARRVYAIEPSDAIRVGRQSAYANGYGDRIQWIQDHSTRVVLPETADVIVSDLRGCLPLHGNHVKAIADARCRFLARGGTLIPQRDTLWLCPVESPDVYRRYTKPWLENAYQLDMRAGHRLVINTWDKARIAKDQFLTSPQCWATLDYRTIEHPNISAQEACVATRAGTAHGMSVWFEASLADGVGFSTAPDLKELVYGSAFFPWAQPVKLTAGDSITISLRADLVGNDYVWQWHTDVRDHADPALVKANFKQSTFLGIPYSASQLRKRAAGFRPTLSTDGQLVRRALNLMADDTTLEDVATCLLDEFPKRFDSHADALAFVGNLSLKYSELSRNQA